MINRPTARERGDLDIVFDLSQWLFSWTFNLFPFDKTDCQDKQTHQDDETWRDQVHEAPACFEHGQACKSHTR